MINLLIKAAHFKSNMIKGFMLFIIFVCSITFTAAQADASSLEERISRIASGSGKAPASSAETEDFTPARAKICFIGDSRVVDMSYVSEEFDYVCKATAEYDWLEGEGKAYIEEKLQDDSLNIVFAFGLNDLENADKYSAYYRDLKARYGDRKIWFLSVGPVIDGANEEGIFNKDIESFNEKISDSVPGDYIDMYSYLTDGDGFVTSDGLHYTKDTYKEVLQYILAVVTVGKTG